MQTPSLGRIVLFTDAVGIESPAIITHVNTQDLEKTAFVSLTIFGVGGEQRRNDVPLAQAEEPQSGHWRWPPRT